MITRQRARSIAEAHIEGHKSSAGQALRIRAVARADELSVRRPFIYGGPRLESCWIAYVERPGVLAIQSSLVVLVSIETGEVLYFGSANDEG